jgi:hypothetical protein
MATEVIMASLYKKVYISIVYDKKIADKEILALARCGHDIGIDEEVEDGVKKYKVYYNAYVGDNSL